MVTMWLIYGYYMVMVNNNLVGGWALPLWKNDGVKVSWDDEIPNIWYMEK